MRAFISAYLRDGTVDINDIGHISDMNEAEYEKIWPLEDLKPSECFHIRPAMLFRINAIPGDKTIKTHCCNGVVHGIELIPAAFTRAAIYVVRDPRDVAISYADHMGLSIDSAIDHMGEYRTMVSRGALKTHLATWSEHVESWTRTLPYKVLGLRYEDMLANPRAAFSLVAQFITKDPLDEKKLDRAVEAVRFGNLSRQEAEIGFVEKSVKQERFFRKGGSTWRSVLTQKQADRIEREHGEVMRKVYG